MKKTILVLTLSATLFGCGNSKIDDLKDSAYRKGLDITLGEIFDDWDACKSSEWSEYLSPEGESIVEYNCDYKNVSTYMPQLRQALLDHFKEKEAYAIRKRKEEVDKYTAVDNMMITFKWQENDAEHKKKNKPFNLFYAAETVTWKNGREKTMEHTAQRAYLKYVYDNDIMLDDKKILNPKSYFGIEHDDMMLYAQLKLMY